MSEIPLNKFEKRDLILRLLTEGKTYREICHIAHVAPRDIKPIAKEYERKKRLETKKEEKDKQTTQIKKPSISSLAFKLFLDGKKLTAVAIDLQIPAKRALRLWYQFLKLDRMYDCYEFYQAFQSQIPELLAIGRFIRDNQIDDARKIGNILKEAIDISRLQSYRAEIKNEIEKLKQTKNNYSLNHNTNYQPILPLGLPEHYYRYYYNC